MSIPCRSSYAQDKSRYLKRTAHLAVRNSTDFPIDITLYHPESQTDQLTQTVPPGNFDWVPKPGYIIADDWGIQVNHECIYYLGEVASYGIGGENIPVYTLTWAYVGTIEGSFSCSIDPASANWNCSLSDALIDGGHPGSPAGGRPTVVTGDEKADGLRNQIESKSKASIQIFEFQAPDLIRGDYHSLPVAFSEENKAEFMTQKEPTKQRFLKMIVESILSVGL